MRLGECRRPADGPRFIATRTCRLPVCLRACLLSRGEARLSKYVLSRVPRLLCMPPATTPIEVVNAWSSKLGSKFPRVPS
eukprot:scaffold288617_cov33-Tisochrysis_lutea.AAC.1